MSQKTKKEDNTVLMSDKYLSESGVQGGKVIGEHIVLGSFLVGIPLLIIGVYGLFNIIFGWEMPTNNAIIILVLLIMIIGSLLTIGGFNIYRSKRVKK